MLTTHEPYVMRISRTTVDKLGIKLYDRPSAVVAEVIANSYDADAENVTVKIPLSRWLATKSAGQVVDQGLVIVIEDDGHGMTPDEVNEYYLKVGTDRRLDARTGFSRKKRRAAMGRKGIGKLAPFGICKIIEVRTAGGELTPAGYKTAHFILNYDGITQDTDEPYPPDTGPDDGKFSKKSGTTITLRNFLPRRTPDAETFRQQLARRFGLSLPDFRIRIVDTTTGSDFDLGHLDCEIQEQTKIVFDEAIDFEDTKLPVKGWVAYSKEPYSNAEVAGVRIYARGKIVSTTRDFGLQAGFTGEYTIRSYLVGEIFADWLDEDEDLIRSDRQDILWDSEKGQAFQDWGRKLLRQLGKTSFFPMREKTWKKFVAQSNLEAEARERFEDEAVIDAALAVGKTIGQTVSGDDFNDPEYIERLKELVLTIAPQKMLVDSLREVAKDEDRPLEIVAKLLNDAKIAEKAALGGIALERVEGISKLETTISKFKPTEDEKVLQKLLESAPWLVNPEWTVLQANMRFENLRERFQQWYLKTEGKDILTTTEGTAQTKKPDFIMLHIGRGVEIVEIKRPDHAFIDEEFERLRTYWDSMNTYLSENPTIKYDFPYVHMTLICDRLSLGRTPSIAYETFKRDGDLQKKTWDEVLTDTKKFHQSFIEAYKRGKRKA